MSQYLPPQVDSPKDSYRRIHEPYKSILKKYDSTLKANPNVVGFGIGWKRGTDPPETVISIHIKNIQDDKEPNKLPSELDGIPVELVNTGGGIIAL